jgi:hypothetical protein
MVRLTEQLHSEAQVTWESGRRQIRVTGAGVP